MPQRGNAKPDDFDSLFDLALGQFRRNPRYHLTPFFALGKNDPFASSVIHACLRCQKIGLRAPRNLLLMVLRNGSDRQLDALLQALAEVYVLAWLASIEWPIGATFEYEPKGKNRARPELRVRTPERAYLFEVKAPSFADFQLRRNEHPFQIVSRSRSKQDADWILGGEEYTLPPDNKLKDFLKSADRKFAGTKSPGDLAFLVVVWDEQLHEPVSALLSPGSGLLTPQSFDRDDDGTVIVRPHVDGVLLVSRLGLFRNTVLIGPLAGHPDVMNHTYQEPLPTGWARRVGDPPVPQFLADQLHIVEAGTSDMFIPELQPIEAIHWVGARGLPGERHDNAEPVHMTISLKGGALNSFVDLSVVQPEAAYELLAEALEADCIPGVEGAVEPPTGSIMVRIVEGDRTYLSFADPLDLSPQMSAFVNAVLALERESRSHTEP